MKQGEIDITVKNNEKLMLQALSSLYPYDVILHFDDALEEEDQVLYSLRENGGRILINDAYYLLEVKPYLRTKSSMTIEEIARYRDLCAWNDVECYEFGEWTTKIVYNDTWESIDYLNSIHVDYRDLIPMGLAIEVTKENNPYKELKL